MREIKFRAWNKLAHKMCMITMCDFMLDAYRATAGKSSGSGHLADIELMQFTGLLDKNGKEIYEGDIIHDPLTGKHYPVVFENGAFRTNGLVECNAFPNDEVIGNIYENPEILQHQ